jgi:2-oxoglutarate ferredoxin oxidoreductase subunit alpha
MIRPITLWPFPAGIIQETAKNLHDFFVFEMSIGQMVEDVRLSLEGKGRIHFHGRPGGVISTPAELSRIIARHYHQSKRKRGR